MSGSTTMGMGVGTVGLGWSQIGGLALGERHTINAVLALQVRLNRVKVDYPEWRPGSDITEDGIYASETHGRVKSLLTWALRSIPSFPECSTGVGVDQLDLSGPATIFDCLNAVLTVPPYAAFSRAQMNLIQGEWNAWKAAGVARPGGEVGPATDPYASSRTDCAARGGTWSDITHTCTAAPGVEPEGLSTGMWILLALIGAAVAYGVYYVITEG